MTSKQIPIWNHILSADFSKMLLKFSWGYQNCSNRIIWACILLKWCVFSSNGLKMTNALLWNSFPWYYYSTPGKCFLTLNIDTRPKCFKTKKPNYTFYVSVATRCDLDKTCKTMVGCLILFVLGSGMKDYTDTVHNMDIKPTYEPYHINVPSISYRPRSIIDFYHL